MLRRITAIGLAISVLLLVLASLPMQRAFALTATVTSTPCGAGLTITGKVVNASNGVAIAGATVIADTLVSHPFATTTAADGTYTLSIPAASNYACLVNGLRVTAAGYDEASRVMSAASLRTQPVQNFSLTAGSAVITSTRTPAPGCGTRVVVTSTPSPTFTPTPRTATSTPTTCAPIYITATPGGSVNLPDLTVLSITEYGYTAPTPTPDALGCWQPNLGGRIGLRMAIQNNGSADAGEFVVDLNGIQQWISGLPAGQTMSVDFPYLGQTIPRSRVANVDVMGMIDESNETNNTYSLILTAATSTSTGTAHPRICNTKTPTPTITVTPLTNGPDLVIASIKYVGSSPACINAPKDNVVISNIGNAAAGAFILSINGGSTPVSGLAAGQSMTFVLSAITSITATIDSTNVIAETNENNNTSSAMLPIPTQAFTCTPPAPILTSTPTPTTSNTPQPYLSGYVRLGSSTGPGLANVNVCYYLAGYTFDCAKNTVLTDQTGYYKMNICVPRQETVTIQASLSGYNFTPASYSSSLYIGCKTGTYDFVAKAFGVTPGTPTPTRTPTVSPTPTNPGGLACNPLTATISVPFVKDGAGTFCWQASALGTYINSWNLTSLQVNGVNFTNAWAPISSLPAKVGGYWYIRYNGVYAWSHFEAK